MKKHKHSGNIQQSWRHWHYKNTALLLFGLAAFLYLVQLPAVDDFLRNLGELGYIGAFIAGLFFVSTFTAAPAGVVLYHLAGNLHPVEVSLLAGLGAMFGDYLIFRFMKDGVFDELRPLLGGVSRHYLRPLLRTPLFAWILPVLGAAMIASPLPDEIGVGILGLSKIRRWQFLVVTFLLNVIGIFLIVMVAKL